MVEIVNIIPFGKENAISRKELTRITGLDDRTVRELISEARTEVVILSAYDGTGYFRPTEAEKKEAEIWLNKEKHRAISTIRSLRAAKRFINEGRG